MAWLAGMHLTLGDMTGWDVYEIGSFIENGSPRGIFGRYVNSYTGIDQRAGLDRGVDIVADAANLPLGDRCADLVISTEMLEHAAQPGLAVQEMARILRPGGHLLLTARGFDDYGGYPYHPCPDDYWRFHPTSIRLLLDAAGLQEVEVIPDPEIPGVFAHAVKGGR